MKVKLVLGLIQILFHFLLFNWVVQNSFLSSLLMVGPFFSAKMVRLRHGILLLQDER